MRSSAENREMLLAAARRLLKEKGLANPVQSITLREAHEVAGVPQQSAYRIYQGQDVPPQTAFQRDVLAHLLTDDPLSTFDTKRGKVVPYLTENYSTITSGTPYEMGVVFREMMRLSTNAWVEAAAESDGYAVLLTTAIATRRGTDGPDLDSLLKSTTRPVAMHRDVHDAVIEMFGTRYRDGHSAGRILAIWSSMLAGNLISSALNPENSIIYRDTGPDGSPQPWNPVGLQCEALTVRVMEADPNADRSMSFEPLTNSKWVEAPDTAAN